MMTTVEAKPQDPRYVPSVKPKIIGINNMQVDKVSWAKTSKYIDSRSPTISEHPEMSMQIQYSHLLKNNTQ